MKEFAETYKEDVSGITAILAVEGPLTAGECQYPDSIITINMLAWPIMSEAKRKNIIFHELGHCAFKILQHNEKRLKDGCPASIMYKDVLSEECLSRHWAQYVEELKSE
jgi:hypothetical protein